MPISSEVVAAFATAIAEDGVVVWPDACNDAFIQHVLAVSRQQAGDVGKRSPTGTSASGVVQR